MFQVCYWYVLKFVIDILLFVLVFGINILIPVSLETNTKFCFSTSLLVSTSVSTVETSLDGIKRLNLNWFLKFLSRRPSLLYLLKTECLKKKCLFVENCLPAQIWRNQLSRLSARRAIFFFPKLWIFTFFLSRGKICFENFHGWIFTILTAGSLSGTRILIRLFSPTTPQYSKLFKANIWWCQIL